MEFERASDNGDSTRHMMLAGKEHESDRPPRAMHGLKWFEKDLLQ